MRDAPHRHRSRWVLAFAVALSACHAQEAPATVLFVDDKDLVYRPATERVLHKMERSAGNEGVAGVMQPTLPWESSLGYTSVHVASTAEQKKTGRAKFMLWYQCCPPGCPDLSLWS